MNLNRGLCRTHYQNFLNTKKALEANGGSSVDWESAVVRLGFVATDGRKPEDSDIFQEIADLVAEQKIAHASQEAKKTSAKKKAQ